MKDREDNRSRMPSVAAFVDQLRLQGQTVRVLYARENGIEVGRKPPLGNAFHIPPNYRKPAGGWKC